MTESVSTLENHSSSRADWLRELQETVARRTEAEQAYLTQFASGIDPQHDALKRVLAEVVDEQERHETNLRERFDQQRREIEQQFRAAILHFEPRIIPDSLQVRLIQSHQNEFAHIGFEIKGELWALPNPERIFFRTDIDLETGVCEVNGAA